MNRVRPAARLPGQVRCCILELPICGLKHTVATYVMRYDALGKTADALWALLKR